VTVRVQTTSGGVRFSVRVQPRASADEIVGAYGESLKVRITAVPVDNAANEALVRFIATTFDIPAAFVTIVSGSSSRTKILELRGITEDRVRQLLQT
jgi:uncharacterized protein